MNDIGERINYVLVGRTASDLTAKYGLNQNWVQLLKKGKGTYKLIFPLILCENISADWLLSGYGQPYRVNHWFDAGQMSKAVIDLLEDIKSNVYLIGGDGVLIWKRAFLEWKAGEMTEFIAYEAHFGPFNKALVSRLKQPGINVRAPYIDPETTKQLKSGEVGTYHLFGYPHEVDGIFTVQDALHSLSEDEIDAVIAESTNAPDPLELSLVRQFRDLTEVRQQVVQDVLASYRSDK